jgi:hypothetical protein
MDSYDEYSDSVERPMGLHFHLGVAVSSALMVHPTIGNCSSVAVHDMEVLPKDRIDNSFRTLGDGDGDG